MIRYSTIAEKNPREIVLLKSFKCKHSRCTFCDYINDNEEDEDFIVSFNKDVLNSVTGCFKQLEIINSASIFELPKSTWSTIKELCYQKNIQTLYFECHYMYKNRLNEVYSFFENINIIFKCGIETFDNDFRNKVLKKGVFFNSPKEVSKYFKSICLLVGIQGQSQEMIDNDINIALKYFDRICINLYINNSTSIKSDENLKNWFIKKYSYLNNNEKVEILINNTDFGVGK